MWDGQGNRVNGGGKARRLGVSGVVAGAVRRDSTGHHRFMAESVAGSSDLANIDRLDRTERTAVLVDRLHAIVEELEEMHPGRKIPLDGHLVGSIGEAAAETLFELELVTTSSTGHDAVAADGRKVEIKATYGTKGVANPEDLP